MCPLSVCAMSDDTCRACVAEYDIIVWIPGSGTSRVSCTFLVPLCGVPGGSCFRKSDVSTPAEILLGARSFVQVIISSCSFIDC